MSSAIAPAIFGSARTAAASTVSPMAGVIHYTAPGRLINNFVRAFLQSRDGAIWIATDEGVSRIAGGDTQNYAGTQRPGLLQHPRAG